MRFSFNTTALATALLLAVSVILAPSLRADTVEQNVRLKVVDPGDGSQCQVQAVFKGDHDNCKNDKANGRDDCSKDGGCVCTRKEKHITWIMEDKEAFSVKFDQGNENPFVQKGSHECKFESNKKGKLRCRVKGKNTPKGIYRYSINVKHCQPAVAQIKVY